MLVVTYESATDIGDCLRALVAQQVPGGVEVVVVDNASSDGSAQLVAQFPVRLLVNDDNEGYAAANERAFRQTAGDLVALVNPDCAPAADCLARLTDHLDMTPEAGVAAALLLDPDGTEQHFARRRLVLSDVLWDLTEVGRRIDRRWRRDRGRRRRRYVDGWDSSHGPFAVDTAAAACVVVRRRDVGPRLFDPALPLYFNDTELYDRVHAAGLRCDVVPAATAVHGYGTSMRRVTHARRRAEFVASMRIYTRGAWPAPRRAALTALLLADLLTSAALARVGPRPSRARARAHARGTAGGLGLPLGDRWAARPWLIDPRWGGRAPLP